MKTLYDARTKKSHEANMRIDEYRFGIIVIGGKKYTSDVVIMPSRILSQWWRRKGHELHIDDIKEAINERPDVLIIGTGFHGVMRVLPETKRRIKEMGCEIIECKTTEACQVFNSLSDKKRVVAALHLTC